MTNVDNVRNSLGRANRKGMLFDRFYEIFLASNSAIKPMFANTDMANQKQLLRQGLNLTIMFAEGNPVGESGLNRIRRSHAKNGLNIDPKMYRFWKASFLQAVSECDPDHTPDLAQDWDDLLQKAIDHIAAGYNSPITAANHPVS